MPYKDPKVQKEKQKAIERGLPGFLVKKYTNMRLRTEGRSTGKPEYWKGVPICSKDEFISWSLNNFGFRLLYAQWVNSGYLKRLTPVPDRKKAELGYVTRNIRWVTKWQNDINARKKYGQSHVRFN